MHNLTMNLFAWGISGFAAALVAGCGPTRTWTFEEGARWPRAWQGMATNPNAALATWEVVDDATTPDGGRVFALTHTASTGPAFNLAVADEPTPTDLELRVLVKAVSGKEDQGGGPVWRFQDADNYYICRINPLQGNYRVYVVAEGKRRQLASADVALEAGRWYELGVTMKGEAITCRLDGKTLLEARDATMARAGRVGLWTKADAATAFDRLEMRALLR